VLERGVVREIGRHDELLARPNGVYARLYALQMFEGSQNGVATGENGSSETGAAKALLETSDGEEEREPEVVAPSSSGPRPATGFREPRT
jgi:hypothetical protein